MGGIMVDNSKTGTILGVLSILPVLVSIIAFFILRGPNANVYLIIAIFGILSIIGIVLAVISAWMSKRRISKLIIGLVGLSANVAVLAAAYLLLLAMGISEV